MQPVIQISVWFEISSLVWVHVANVFELVVIMELTWQKEMYPMIILNTMITYSKIFFDHKCNYVLFADYREGSRSFATYKMEFFMTIEKARNR